MESVGILFVLNPLSFEACTAGRFMAVTKASKFALFCSALVDGRNASTSLCFELSLLDTSQFLSDRFDCILPRFL